MKPSFFFLADAHVKIKKHTYTWGVEQKVATATSISKMPSRTIARRIIEKQKDVYVVEPTVQL